MKQFHQTFFEESFEGLDIMETELLNLDMGDTDSDVINTIFRAAHSIKGGSGTFGFTSVAEFTHVVETLLDEMRDGKRAVTQKAVDLLLKSVDIIRDMLSALRDGDEMDAEQVAIVHKQLEKLLAGDTPAPVAATAATSSKSASAWEIYFHPHTDMLRTGNDPVRMIRALAELGELEVTANISKLPALADLIPEDSHLAWTITLSGETSEMDIREIFEWVDDECDLEIKPAGHSTPAKNAQSAPAEKESAARKSKSASAGEASSIRVSTDKVDEIINLVGELVITQSMLGQMGSDIENSELFDTTRVENLREGLSQLERNTRELQESVMRIRMLPINFVFSRVPRLIHDLSSKLGKKVELVITGEQTELDKTVMEKIGDPMVHLVRNALDHGLETPAERIAAGKEETGHLYLNAYHKGGNIVIEVEEDGAGLNREKILDKARGNGLIGDDESLSDEEIQDLIFQPGFSTADEVSDVSGRGVGMDVVRKNIKSLGGTVEVSSKQGQGTKFTIRLPLTLAILDGQLVRVGSETYIFPLISIIESLQVKAGAANVVAGKGELYRLRDEYIPIIRAHRIFGIPDPSDDLNGSLMVVVECDGKKAGIIVDDLLAQQQVVIKSLETNFKKVDGISGATILGDGTVALIMDVSGLMNMFHNSSHTPVPPSTPKDNDDVASAAA